MVALTACSGGNNKGTTQPTESPTPSLSQPTMSASEAKKAAAEAKAAQEAHARELRAWTASVEKAMKAQTSPFMKLGVIITEYCKIPYVVRELEPDRVSVLKKLYDANWQAGKWNKDLRSASEQPGACPQDLPQKPSQS
jgi:hypothetical protein